jgi:RNA polymerase sigma-70 factor (ECF subfamily)
VTTPSPTDLDEAVRRVAAGDRAAFDQVVTLATPRLYRLAARILGDEQEAQDVLQEAMIRAFDAMTAGTYEGRSGAFTWLYRVVTNAALDAMRSRKRRAARFDPDESSDHEELVATAEVIAARAALRELGELLKELPPEQRTAIVLKEVEGLSTAEIAEAMGSSIGAVEQRLVRARATLRSRWSRE